MSNRVKLFFCFLFLYSFTCFAQEKEKISQDFIVKIDGLSYLDFYSGVCPRIGLEHPLFNKVSMYHEVGFYVPISSAKWQGYAWKSELKVSGYESGTRNKIYFSLEGEYKEESYEATRELSSSTTPRPKADFTVNKSILTFSTKLGYMLFSKKGFLFEAYVGPGIRFRHVENTLNRKLYNDGIFFLDKDQEGDFITPNITGGIKVGYRFLSFNRK